MDISYHCLDDDLAKVYHDFKRGNKVNGELLIKFLRFYRPNHKTNLQQMRRIKLDDTSMLSQLANSPDRNKSLDELSKDTVFKYILSSEKTDFPYRSIDNNNFKTEVIYSFNKNESRNTFFNHFKALVAGAKTVVVSDCYLEEKHKELENFYELFDKNKCTLCLTFGYSNKAYIGKIKKINNKFKIIEDSRSEYSTLHDRYILIDEQIELIITSGIDYLFDNSKECTIVIRHKEK